MATAAVPLGGTVAYQQVGDVTLGERREYVYMEDENDNAALVEKKITTAQVPLEGGVTAILTGVEYTTVAATEQPSSQQGNDDIPATQRIPDNNTHRPAAAAAPQPVPSRSRLPSYPINTTVSTTQQRPPAPPIYQASAGLDAHRTRPRPRGTTHTGRTRTAGPQTTLLVKGPPGPWDKCQQRFCCLWIVLLSCLGIAGVLFIGLGALTYKCNKESKVAVFELWTSSYAAGAVMVLFTLCMWLSLTAYCISRRRNKELFIGVVTGCGILAGFFFIIAFGFNVSAIGMVVGTSTVNGTLHDLDCLSPYWMAYFLLVPPTASGAVLLALLFSFVCCVFCRVCFCVFCGTSRRPTTGRGRVGYTRLN